MGLLCPVPCALWGCYRIMWVAEAGTVWGDTISGLSYLSHLLPECQEFTYAVYVD